MNTTFPSMTAALEIVVTHTLIRMEGTAASLTMLVYCYMISSSWKNYAHFITSENGKISYFQTSNRKGFVVSVTIVWRYM